MTWVHDAEGSGSTWNWVSAVVVKDVENVAVVLATSFTALYSVWFGSFD